MTISHTIRSIKTQRDILEMNRNAGTPRCIRLIRSKLLHQMNQLLLHQVLYLEHPSMPHLALPQRPPNIQWVQLIPFQKTPHISKQNLIWKVQERKRRSSKPYTFNHPCTSEENVHSDVNTRDVQYSEQPQIHSGVMHNYAPLSVHHPQFGESHGDFKPDLHMAPPAFSGVPTWNPTYSGLESGSGMHSSPFYHGIREDHVGGHEYEPYSSPAVAPTLSNRAFGVQVSQQPHQKPSVFNNMQTYSYLPQQ